jgi:ATP-binding cassette subfamily F protein 3
MDDYTAVVLGRTPAPGSPAREQRPASPAKARRSIGLVHKKIQEIESDIQKIREKIEVMDRALADPELYAREPRKAADFTRLRSRLATDLDQAEHLWLEAHEELPVE